jgi:hypothetical protein
MESSRAWWWRAVWPEGPQRFRRATLKLVGKLFVALAPQDGLFDVERFGSWTFLDRSD